MKCYNVKLIFNPESIQNDSTKLLQTLEINKDIWNDISEFVYNNKMITNAKLVQDSIYYKCTNKFQNVPCQIIIRAMHDVISTYKTLKSNIKSKLIEKESVTEPCNKHNLSMRLDKRLYTLKNNSIKLTVVNSPNKRITCTFDYYPKIKEMLQYSIGDPLIFYRNKIFWLSIPFNTPEPLHNSNSCIGIDLGLKRIAFTSEGIMIKGKEFLKHKRRIRYLKSCLREKKKNRLKKSDSARKHLKKLKRKERNISKNYLHKYINEILKTKSNTIVLEDLSKIKQQNKGKRLNSRRSQVPFFEFKTILTYKALSLGKRVVTVNPAYTSQDDYRGIERGKRMGCRYYASDGKVFDADLNAAINIGQRWGKKNKLPISFVFPIDGKYKRYGQAVCQSAERLVPMTRQVHDLKS